MEIEQRERRTLMAISTRLIDNTRETLPYSNIYETRSRCTCHGQCKENTKFILSNIQL